MALNVDNETLTKELKMGAKVGRNFLFSPASKPEDSFLALSKKRIPPAEHKAAKKASKKPLVLFGSCFKEGSNFVFETPDKVSPALTQKLRKCIRAKSDYPPAKALLRQNAGWVEAEFEDESTDGDEPAKKGDEPLLAGTQKQGAGGNQFEYRRAQLRTLLAKLDELGGYGHDKFVSREKAIGDAGLEAVSKSAWAEADGLLTQYEALVKEVKGAVASAARRKKEFDAVAGDLPKIRKGIAALVKAKHPDAKDLVNLLGIIDGDIEKKDWDGAASAIRAARSFLAEMLKDAKDGAAFSAELKKHTAMLKAALKHDPGPFRRLQKLYGAFKRCMGRLQSAMDARKFESASAELVTAVKMGQTLLQLDKDYAAYQKFVKANKAAYEVLSSIYTSCPPNAIWKDELKAFGGVLRKYLASDFKGALADLKKVVEKVPDLKKKIAAYDKEATKKAGAATTELKDLVKGKTFSFPDTAQGKKDEAKLVKTLSDEVAKLKPEKQIQLLADLHGPMAKLTKEQRIMQRALYRQIKLDKAFQKADGKLRDAYQNALKDDKQLQDTVGGWNKKNPDGTPVVDNAKKKAAIERILKQQCASLKIPVPQIDWFYENSASCGSFNRATGVMRLNEYLLSDMGELIDTALHENTHNYQFQLCERFIDGEIKPNDPLYVQAKTFATLQHPDAYVPPKEDYEAYKTQPLEDHAWDAGGTESKRLVARLKQERRKRLKEEAEKRKKGTKRVTAKT